MSVKVAKTAGFCFGVSRAVNQVFDLLKAGKKVATLGPIIHNPQMVKTLCERGVIICKDLNQCPDGYTLVIRSHGVPQSVIDEIEKRRIPYVDATCPFVKKIHAIVAASHAKQTQIILVGDCNHPEVQGIVGHCNSPCMVAKDSAELEAFLRTQKNWEQTAVILLAQTTYNQIEWQNCVEKAKKVCTNLNIFDTICDATVLRQREADALSREVPLMVVVGGAQSSNTAKLAEICRKNCRTILIEKASELLFYNFGGVQNAAITAGASTPACIIKEVQETMTEILEGQQEQSFSELLEQSFKSTYTGEKVTGVVIGIKPTEIEVDIGCKYAGYVELSELTADPTAKPEDLVKVGDELELLVIRVNDVEGKVMLSKRRLDAIAGFEKVMNAEESGEILEGVVTDVVNGGVIVVSNGVKVFIPASQTSVPKNGDLAVLLKQPVSFKILEVNRQRRRAVGSIKAVTRMKNKELQDKFWAEVEVGKVYKGVVKSMTDYGVFVDLGGVDGMVHISELSWQRIKHPSEVVKVGDLLEVYVKDINEEKKRISLGYKKNEDNPWEIFKNNYHEGQVIQVKIVQLTNFGAFAQIIPGIDGLIHISQISTQRIKTPADVLKVGDEVDVAITGIDLENKRISLSIRKLLEDQAEAAQTEEVATEAPVEE